MAHLIDKDALVAEIERRKNEEVDYDEDSKNFASYADHIHYSTLDSMEDFINTLEVKEVGNMTKEEAVAYIIKNNITHPRCRHCRNKLCSDACEDQVDEELIQYVMEGKL